jgi:MFS family permease
MGPLGNAFASLGVRDYRYLVLSNFSSQIGLWIAMVAEGWLAFQLTGSATYLGVVSASRAIPSFILTLPGGVLADRLDRRRVIAVSQLLLALNAAAVSYLVLSDLVQPWHLIVSSIVSGVSNSINMPARQALAPQLAGRQFIANAVALNAISFNASRIIGPSIAGFILAQWGIGPCYACYTVLLAVAMFWVTRISVSGGTEGQAVPQRVRASMWANMVEGLGYIRQSREISSIMAVAIIPIYLEMIYQNLLPVFADDILDVGGPGLAKMVTAVGIGSMIGGFVTAALSTTRARAW